MKNQTTSDFTAAFKRSITNALKKLDDAQLRAIAVRYGEEPSPKSTQPALVKRVAALAVRTGRVPLEVMDHLKMADRPTAARLSDEGGMDAVDRRAPVPTKTKSTKGGAAGNGPIPIRGARGTAKLTDMPGADALPPVEDPAGPYRKEVDAALDDIDRSAKKYAETPEELEKIRKKIVKTYDRWRTAAKNRTAVSKEQNEAVSAAEGKFREIMVDKPPAKSATREEVVTHLRSVQREWNGWEGVKREAAANRKDARDSERAARKALENAIENARQLPLPGMEES